MTDVASSYITRWITFAIAPFVTAAAVVVAAKSGAWFGVPLTPAEVVAFVLGLVGPIVTWLYNRGKWEIAQVFGQKTAADVDEIVERVIEKLPAPPTAPAPGHGSPAEPRAPGA